MGFVREVGGGGFVGELRVPISLPLFGHFRSPQYIFELSGWGEGGEMKLIR